VEHARSAANTAMLPEHTVYAMEDKAAGALQRVRVAAGGTQITKTTMDWRSASG